MIRNKLKQQAMSLRASQHFRSFWGAWSTIAGYEAIHMIRKGQARWSAKVGLLQRFILGDAGVLAEVQGALHEQVPEPRLLALPFGGHPG